MHWRALAILLALAGCQAQAAPRHLSDGEPGGVWCFYHDVTVRFPPPAVTCPKPWRPDRVKGS